MITVTARRLAAPADQPKHDATPGTRIARRVVLAVVAVISALAAITPGAANAGTYPMYNCHVSGHETGNHGPWTYSTAFGAPGTTLVSACSGPGSSSGPEFGPYAPTYLGVNSRSNLTLQKDNHNISIGTVKLWFYGSTRIAPGYPAGPITTTLWLDGVKRVEWSAGQIADFRAVPYEFHANGQVQLSLACAGSGSGCMPDGGFPLQVSGVQTDLVESLAPGASITGGTLTAAGAQKGTKTVAVQGTDPDSGVRKVDVLLDDHVVGKVDYDRDWTKQLTEQQAGTCAYDSWNACPTSQTPSFNVDTRLVPDGTYALTSRVTDAAGNVTTTAPRAVTIDNVPDTGATTPPVLVGAPGPAGNNGANGGAGANGPTGTTGPVGAAGAVTTLTRNGANASPGADLKARFVGYTSTAIRAPYGRRLQLTGQLVAPGGAPIAGAKVTVLQQDKSVGATLVPKGEVLTDAQGRFVYTMVATRSATIRFAYRANLEDAAFAKTFDVGLGVVPKISLKANHKSLRNGQRVRFSGAIAGAPTSLKKVVELQVHKRSHWMTFASTRLSRGKFAYSYRFTSTHKRTTYRFRARVRQEAGFPFLDGTSKTVKVTVRG